MTDIVAMLMISGTILEREAADEIERLRAERDALRHDAKRYRWLRDRLVAAEFDWGEKSETVLIFSFPSDVGVGGNCDQNIDAALAANRPCTCHPDDNPPRPCPQKFALSECRVAALAAKDQK